MSSDKVFESELNHCLNHFRRFYSESEIKQNPPYYRERFRGFVKMAIEKYPELLNEKRFNQEITRIKGALK